MVYLRRIYALFMAVGLVLNGYLYVAWFRAPPNPDRIGYWVMQFFAVLPVLGLLALATLIFARCPRLGVPVLIYVVVALIIANQPWLIAWMLPWITFEQLYVVLWLATIVALLAVGRKALWDDEEQHRSTSWRP
ncbi:MAG: hypothetical protein WCI67_22410 [Chloroflexales bacterium]